MTFWVKIYLVFLPLNAVTAATLPIKAKCVSSGDHRSCVITEEDNVVCWGVRWKQKRMRSPVSLLPTLVPNLANVKKIAVGGNHNCAVLGDDTLKCWGNNKFGQLGTRKSDDFAVEPVAVEGLANVLDVSAGSNSSCALMSSGGVKCWGQNQAGELGVFHKDVSFEPLEVLGIQNAKALKSGGQYHCVITAEGNVTCWGKDTAGKPSDDPEKIAEYVTKGVPLNTQKQETLSLVPGLTSMKSISASLFFFGMWFKFCWANSLSWLCQ